MLKKPSNNRNWSLDQKILPYAVIRDNFATIYNIRNFKYEAVDEYKSAYYDKIFNLNKIKSLDFIQAHYSKLKAAAHTFLSFSFDDGGYISVSIEIRKRVGQKFSHFKALFIRYEIMYVIADERDLIKLRTNYRHEKVYIFPVKASKEKIRDLFLDILARANKLKAEPEFYHPFTNTCTTNIIKHINAIAPNAIPRSYHVLLPGYLDKLAFALGLIDSDRPREEVKAACFVNDKALKCGDSEDFSRLIRI